MKYSSGINPYIEWSCRSNGSYHHDYTYEDGDQGKGGLKKMPSSRSVRLSPASFGNGHFAVQAHVWSNAQEKYIRASLIGYKWVRRPSKPRSFAFLARRETINDRQVLHSNKNRDAGGAKMVLCG